MMCSTVKIISSLVFALSLYLRGQGGVLGINPQTYPSYFMNISTTTDYSQGRGFIQLFGCSVNTTSILIQASNESYNGFKPKIQIIPGDPKSFYNFTPELDSILRQLDPNDGVNISNFGIVVSSKDPISFIGVKSDRGTTDAFLSLPVMDSSTEFFIAGWPKQSTFIAEIMLVAALDSTCVEVYKVFGGSRYVRLAGGSINAFQVYRYFPGSELLENLTTTGQPEDVTGYYVNSTQPVGVYFGHECAWVPSDSVFFCDYIVEQIPPISQLGLRHVVPPIRGRSSAAGYLVRVVPTGVGATTISYLGGLSASRQRGEWLEFTQPLASAATMVVCSQPCVVMQYNVGYLAVPGDVPTDPFMQLVVPDDRFTAGVGFATANFCQGQGIAGNCSLTLFNNYISVVTFDAYKSNILFDQQPILLANQIASWTSLVSGGVTYAIISFPIDHGGHVVNMAPDTYGSLAVYVYGHSFSVDSSSAYGYAANYNITGVPVSSVWNNAAAIINNLTSEQAATACMDPSVLTGSIIKDGQFISFPFTLHADIVPPTTLDPVLCFKPYNDSLYRMLQNFTQQINYWICTSQNCSYLGGVGVALDYSALQVNWIGTAGVYSAVEVYINMLASFSTSAQNFAQCRADIAAYMNPFVNWPFFYTSVLLPTRPSSVCTWPLPFAGTAFVRAAPLQCPVYAMGA